MSEYKYKIIKRFLIAILIIVSLDLLTGCAASGPPRTDEDMRHMVRQCKAQHAYVLCHHYGPNRTCQCVEK